MMARSLLAAAVVAFVFACGGGGEEPDGTTAHVLETDAYTIAPGEERYICQTFRSPSDRTVAISAVSASSGLGEHHVVVFQTTPEEQEGTFDCPSLVRLNWQPIWGGGTGSPSMTLPQDVAFKIRPNTQYLVQLHLQNASDSDIVDRSKIEFTYLSEEEAEQATSAGIFAIGSFDIDIPAQSQDHTLTTNCTLERELNVFAAFPHMHKLGTKIELFHGADEASAESIYKLDPWPFDDQPMDLVDWKIEIGEHARVRCHWNNPTDEAVVFGDSSDDEMCFFVLFYYPSDGTAGCIDGI